MEAILGYVLVNAGSLVGLVALFYLLIILVVAVYIIQDTESASKALGYLLLIFFIPLMGVILYFSFGMNYRTRKMYSKKLNSNELFEEEVTAYIEKISTAALESGSVAVESFRQVTKFISYDPIQSVSNGNAVQLLSNGERAFPEILQALEMAQETIHLEYYIVRNDQIANQIKEILIRKAKAGIKIRFIYDDFGSRPIHGAYVNELRAAGIEIYPFRKVILIALANRLNYRNHRKIIVIDGRIAFVGGMNIGDEYINHEGQQKAFFRDMHLKISGPACYSLQNIFLCDWNFCSEQDIHPDEQLFPVVAPSEHNHIAQIIASGPDSKYSMIMYSIMQAIILSKREILITTPYFVPSESIMDALKLAALSKVKIKILVPYRTNSLVTQYASRSYYDALMKAGIEIYRYKQGFIHAKTSIFDGEMVMVGTANMDNRSFNLNFEVNAVVYDENIATEMRAEFYQDLKCAERIDFATWCNRPKYTRFIEKIAHLASSLL